MQRGEGQGGIGVSGTLGTLVKSGGGKNWRVLSNEWANLIDGLNGSAVCWMANGQWEDRGGCGEKMRK